MRRAAVWVLLGVTGALGLARAQEPVPTASATPAPATPVAPTPSAPPSAPRPMSPDELRARERAIILSLQTIMLAERSYAASNGGLFDEMRCLGEPWKCVPGYPADGAGFLDPTYDWLETRLDYVPVFHPGPRATPEEVSRAKASPTSLKSWAFTATPLHPGVTGLRGLCCDAKGRLCMGPEDGRQPPVKDGLCEPCKKLQ